MYWSEEEGRKDRSNSEDVVRKEKFGECGMSGVEKMERSYDNERSMSTSSSLNAFDGRRDNTRMPLMHQTLAIGAAIQLFEVDCSPSSFQSTTSMTLPFC